MNFPIKRREIIPQHLKGAGDVVAMVAEPIKKVILKHTPKIIGDLLKNCNCDKRRESLNKVIPFVG